MEFNSNSLHLLLVDDDDVACESVIRGLRKHNINYPIHLAHDGIEALDILRSYRNKGIAGSVIVLLDLNMPRMNGFEFLQELRNDPRLSKTVVFVLTTSDADRDLNRAYNKNVAGYIVKAVVAPQFTKLANLLIDYESAVSLPSSSANS